MSLVPSVLQFELELETEGTELGFVLGLVVVFTSALALCCCRKPKVETSVVTLPSGLRVSHGS